MRIVFVVSEAAPFAKTGGLADVAGALPKALADLGHDVALLMPLYRSVREAECVLTDTGVRLEVEMPQGAIEGHIVRTALPDSDVHVFLVENDSLFGREHLYSTAAGDYRDNCRRFAFFCRAALRAIDDLDLEPDVIHAHDWQAGLVPPLAAVRFADNPTIARTARVFTIHNLSYQGIFWHWDMPLTGLPWEMFNWQELEFHGKLNLMKGALIHADLITTVSQRYAEEIQTPAFGCGLETILADRADDLVGVINGVDYSVWNPAADPNIPAAYTPDDLAGKAVCKRDLQRACHLPPVSVPLVGMISRLVDQKGFDLIVEAVGDMMDMDLQFVLLGTGESTYEELLAEVGRRFPAKAGVHITFDNELAHRIEAGADIFLMPSRFEPCGLNQLYSLKYGTVPVVHATGGLADTVVDCTGETLVTGRATGFTFTDYTPEAMLDCLTRALDLYTTAPHIWRRLQLTGMKQDFSWRTRARRYVELYDLARDRAVHRPERVTSQ